MLLLQRYATHPYFTVDEAEKARQGFYEALNQPLAGADPDLALRRLLGV